MKEDLENASDGGREIDIYANIVAMLVESALPLSALGIVTCILVGVNNFVSTTFICVWGTVAVRTFISIET